MSDKLIQKKIQHADQLLHLRKYDEAINILSNFLNGDVSLEKITLRLGFAYYCKENYDQALQYFESALSILPEDSRIPYYLSKCHFLKDPKDIQLAHEFIDRALHSNSSDHRNYLAKAQLQLHQENYESAKKNIDSASSINASSLEYFSTTLLYYFNLNEIDECNKILDTALSLYPESSYLLKFKGNIEYAEKEYEAAKLWAMRSLEMNPNNLDAQILYKSSEENKKLQNQLKLTRQDIVFGILFLLLLLYKFLFT